MHDPTVSIEIIKWLFVQGKRGQRKTLNALPLRNWSKFEMIGRKIVCRILATVFLLSIFMMSLETVCCNTIRDIRVQ